jgi:protein-disulfide isomerase
MSDQNPTETPETNTTTQPTRNASPSSWKQSAGIPAAIIIAGVLIAGSMLFDGNRGSTKVNVKGGIEDAQNTQQTPEMEVAPVTEKDHIRGNPNAPIMIVEYSDYECPFCKNFHETMNRIIEEYGTGGKVAWVYRHFPLVQLHPNAPRIAAASYCVAEQTGNDGFWKFSDSIFGNREINAQTDMKKLTDYAVQAGAEKGKFELCLSSGKYTEQVDADVEAAMKTGARGTPYSIVMVGGEQGAINGAQPYDTVKSIVENLIAQLSGGTPAVTE